MVPGKVRSASLLADGIAFGYSVNAKQRNKTSERIAWGNCGG